MPSPIGGSAYNEVAPPPRQAEMKVEFEAEIININVKKDVTMDKIGKLWLEFLPKDEIVDSLNKLMKIDETVKVTITK